MDKDLKKKLDRRVESNRRWIGFWALVFAVVAILLYISIFSQSRVDIGSEDKVMEVKALTCESDDYFYPFFIVDESDDKNMKIIVTFMGEKIRSISLQQMLTYEGLEASTGSEAVNHSSLNEQFGADGKDADSFEASFSAMSSGLRFGIRSDFDKLNSGDMKYFLLDSVVDYDYNRIKQAYEKQGFVCN